MSGKTAPERIRARIYSNGIINARPTGEPFHTRLGKDEAEAEYIRADLDSFYQEKDVDTMQARIEALEAENAQLRNAVQKLLDCPHIADRDPYPWNEPQTEVAVSVARAALGETTEKEDEE